MSRLAKSCQGLFYPAVPAWKISLAAAVAGIMVHATGKLQLYFRWQKIVSFCEFHPPENPATARDRPNIGGA